MIYRSDKIMGCNDWIEKFDDLLSNLVPAWDGLFMIVGDMNINILDDANPVVMKYVNILQSFNLTQHISQPTRSTAVSRTLIDHLITSNPSKISHAAVLPCDSISDHDAVYATVNVRVSKFTPRYKYIRNEKSFKETEYIQDFMTLPLSLVYAMESPDEKLDVLNTLITDCIHRHAPLRRIKVTRPPAPWMQSPAIQELQARQNHLRKQAHQDNSTESWRLFRSVRNELKCLINKTKKTFMRNALSSKRPKEVWRIIHRILHPNPQPIRECPNKLNGHFAQTAQRTIGTQPENTNQLYDLLKSLPNTDEPSFVLNKVKPDEVMTQIRELRSDCSTGIDQIPAKFIKPVASYLASPLAHIINLCIETSSFPNVWKTARISPIPKIDHPKSEDDFRPISILPAMSKIFERIVLKQMLDFIDQTALLGPHMSGFRKGHSTTTPLLSIRNDLVRSMKCGEVSLLVLADYSKAFDTVRFQTVINKMYNMGFSKTFLSWLIEYLSTRRQFVQIDDKCSDMENVAFGVPQGSILGPVIFNLYYYYYYYYLHIYPGYPHHRSVFQWGPATL